MRTLLDTSVLVAAMHEGHEDHSRALPWLQRMRDGEDEGVVACHTLAEVYAVLSALPIRPRLSPATVRELIMDNIVEHFEVVALNKTDYLSVLDHLAIAGESGGAVYDALLLHAAQKADVDRVVTLNERDFNRIFPDLVDKIIAP